MSLTGMRGHLQAGFFLLFLPLLPLLVKFAAEASVAGASRVVVTESRSVAAEIPASEYRIELLMALDLLVRAERVLRVESSMFTRSVGRVPDVLGSLTHYYRIDIARATRNQLLVVATGEGRRTGVADASAVVGDRVAIDEGFRVNSNFPLPVPPRDYLHTLARTVMNRIYNSQFKIPETPELDLWEGVFRGHFRYEVRPISAGGKTIVAVGLRGPVKGDVVEMAPGADLYAWVYQHRNAAWVERELYGQLEKIYFAERIHQEHTGNYSPNFQSLLSNWNGLVGLSSDQSPLVVQDFQLDQTFGFHAELAQRSPATRSWSINGYGQVAEVATVERIVGQFEQARKEVATHGNAISALNSGGVDADTETYHKLTTGFVVDSENPLKDLSNSEAGNLLPAKSDGRPGASAGSLPVSANEEKGRKPLLIDAVDGDK